MGGLGSILKSDDPPMVGGGKRTAAMKRELNEMGMYEDGMSVAEMQELLSVLNESKNEADGMSRENSLAHIESPTAADPAFPERSNSKLNTRDSSSPDIQLNVFSNKNKDRKKSTENEIFSTEPVRSRESLDSDKPPYALSPSPTRSSSAPVAPTPPENHKNVTTRKIQTKLHPHLFPALKIDKWRIDPLDCKKDDDPPLRARSNGGKAPPVRVLVIDGVPQIPEEVSKFINNHLTEVARNHFINNKDLYDEEDIQWGSPIKVGIANGSLDKNPIRERSQTPSTSQEVNETGVALKAVQIEENKGKNEEKDVFSFNDEDDADFESSRKRARTAKPVRQPQESTFTRKTRAAKILAALPKGEEGETDAKDPDWEDPSRPTGSRKRSVKQREASPEASRKREKSPEWAFEVKGKQTSDLSDYVPDSQPDFPESPDLAELAQQQYPRRIVPPNPSRPKGRGGGRKDAVKLLENRPELVIKRIDGRKKKDPGMSENDIQKVLESDIMTDDEDDPIFVSEKTSRRSEKAVTLLAKAREQEDDEERQKREAERARRAREDSERQERVQKKIREENARQRAKDVFEKHDREKTERWNSGVKTRNSWKRTELDGDQPKSTNSVFDWDKNNHPTATANDNEVQMFSENPKTPVIKVQCPICSKSFPQNEIENHAGNCSDYPMEGDSRGGDEVEEIVEKTQLPGLLKCHVCDTFRTRNGNELEEHTAKCIAERNRASGSRTEVIPISDSPPRSFQPVSQLQNSEIDYNSLNKYNSRKSSPRGNDNRKRKRLR